MKKARAGTKIITIDNIEYEIPELIVLYKTPKGYDSYLSGVRTIGFGRYSKSFCSIKILQTNEFIEIPYDLINQYMSNGYQILNLFNETYRIPIYLYTDIVLELRKINKSNKIYYKKILENIEKFKN